MSPPTRSRVSRRRPSSPSNTKALTLGITEYEMANDLGPGDLLPTHSWVRVYCSGGSAVSLGSSGAESSSVTAAVPKEAPWLSIKRRSKV
jgi:hypothetical protein